MDEERLFSRTGRVLQENDEDFHIEVVEWNGGNNRKKTAVLKSMEDTILDRRRDGFVNESIGTHTFRKLALSHPEWGLVVPRTYAEGDTWSIRRFMGGEPILAEGEEFDDLETTQRHIGQLATLLAMIDRVEPDISAPDDPRNSAPYDKMLIRTPDWAIPPIQDGLLDPDDYAAVEQLTVANQPLLVPRYAHGDLMPYAHVFARPDGRLAFIDFEHYSARKPRYYDAAYCYAQMFVKAPDTSLATSFMKELLEKSDPVPHQTEQMTTVLSQRAIRLFFDASFEGLDKTHPQVQRTQNLLDLTLENNLDSLVRPEERITEMA